MTQYLLSCDNWRPHDESIFSANYSKRGKIRALVCNTTSTLLYFNLLSVTKTVLHLKELNFNLVLEFSCSTFPEERKEVAKRARM